MMNNLYLENDQWGDVTGTLVTPSYKPLENDIPILD